MKWWFFGGEQMKEDYGYCCKPSQQAMNCGSWRQGPGQLLQIWERKNKL